MILTVPTPRLYITDDIKTIAQTDESDQSFMNALNTIKGQDKKSIYYFDDKLNEKRFGAILIYTFFAFGAILLAVILFHNKSYIVLPMITSIVLTLIICSSIWLFTNTLNPSIYFDLLNMRQTFGGMKAFQFLSVYIFIEAFVLAFGIWYKIP